MDQAVHLHILVAHILEAEAEADHIAHTDHILEAEVDQVLHLVTYLAILLWDQHLVVDIVDHIVHTDHILEVDQEVEVDQDQEIVLQVDHQALQVFQSTVSLIKVKALRKYLCALTV